MVELAHFYPSSGTDKKVEIGVDDQVTSDLTLERYLESITDVYQNNLGGINVLESGTNFTVAGMPAYKIVFKSNDATTQIMETGLKVGDKVYYITYVAKPESYPSYLPQVQNIANSLRIS